MVANFSPRKIVRSGQILLVIGNSTLVATVGDLRLIVSGLV